MCFKCAKSASNVRENGDGEVSVFLAPSSNPAFLASCPLISGPGNIPCLNSASKAVLVEQQNRFQDMF
jgi:hypothetical protein